MTSEPPTPTGAPDNKPVYNNVVLPSLYHKHQFTKFLVLGFVFHRRTPGTPRRRRRLSQSSSSYYGWGFLSARSRPLVYVPTTIKYEPICMYIYIYIHTICISLSLSTHIYIYIHMYRERDITYIIAYIILVCHVTSYCAIVGCIVITTAPSIILAQLSKSTWSSDLSSSLCTSDRAAPREYSVVEYSIA